MSSNLTQQADNKLKPSPVIQFDVPKRLRLGWHSDNTYALTNNQIMDVAVCIFSSHVAEGKIFSVKFVKCTKSPILKLQRWSSSVQLDLKSAI